MESLPFEPHPSNAPPVLYHGAWSNQIQSVFFVDSHKFQCVFHHRYRRKTSFLTRMFGLGLSMYLSISLSLLVGGRERYLGQMMDKNPCPPDHPVWTPLVSSRRRIIGLSYTTGGGGRERVFSPRESFLFEFHPLHHLTLSKGAIFLLF
jgi:hypothetical protein